MIDSFTLSQMMVTELNRKSLRAQLRTRNQEDSRDSVLRERSVNMCVWLSACVVVFFGDDGGMKWGQISARICVRRHGARARVRAFFFF